MPVHTAIWKVAPQPEPLPESALASEEFLEDMIVAEPRHLQNHAVAARHPPVRPYSVHPAR